MRKPLMTSSIAPLVLLLCLLVSGLASEGTVQAAEGGTAADADRVLLLYDSKAIGHEDAPNVPVTERLLAAFGLSVTPVSLDQYTPGLAEDYPRVVLVRNRSDFTLPPSVWAELDGYTGKRFAVMGGEAALHLASETSTDPLAKWAGAQASALPAGVDGTLSLAGDLKSWLGDDRTGKAYLLLKESYPFSDLELLRILADRLSDAGIPFLLATRPVFQNTDYPAMLRYLEALKYAQSRGGSILVQTPVVKLAATRSDTSLRTKMEGFVDTLIESGIVPLGIVSEAFWTYDREFSVGGLGAFDSAVLLRDENPFFMERMPTSRSFSSSLFTFSPEDLPLEELSHSDVQTLPLPVALPYDLPETNEEMEHLLARLAKAWLPFTDYKEEDHQVATEKHRAGSRNGVLTIDGQFVSTDYVSRPIDEQFEYERKEAVSFAGLFRAQNRFFLVVISAALIAFVVLIGIGRRMYRRKFMK